MSKYMKKVGEKHGRLTVVKFAGYRKNRMLWECNCECGTEKFLVTTKNLNRGHTKSCGCLRREESRKRALYRTLPGNQAAENRVLKQYKSGAKTRNILFELTEKEFLNLIYKNCYYCNSKPKCYTTARRKVMGNIKIYHNGIDRIDSSKSYNINNCVPCCKICNIAKSNLSLEDFLSHIKKISDNIKL